LLCTEGEEGQEVVSQLLQDAFEADEDDLEHRLTGRSVPSKQITM